MQQVIQSQPALGAQRQPAEASSIISDKVQVPTDATTQGDDSPISVKPESKRTSVGRRRHGKISQKDILGILKSVAFQVKESGLPTTVAVLPNNSFAVIVQGAWPCIKCGEFFPGIKSFDGVCLTCKASA